MNHWLDFFLQGVRDTADQALKTAIEIDRLFRADKEKIEDIPDLEKTATLLEGHLGSSLGLRLLRKAEAFQFFSYLFSLEEWAGRDRLREETGVDRQIVKSPVAWHSDHVQVGKRHVQMFSVSPFGQPSEMDRISVTAERHSLPVIDDAAQSFGAVHKGKQLIGMKVLASK